MTNPQTIEEKKLIFAQQHEARMEILRWFTRNKQAPYLLMIAGGVGFAYVAKVMSGEATTPQEDKGFWDEVGKGLADAFSKAAPMAGVLGILAAMTASDTSKYEMTGAGIAAIGFACLLLDAAGGASGVSTLLGKV